MSDEAPTAERATKGHGTCSVEIVPPPGLTATLSAECFEGEPALDPTDIITDQQELIVKVKLCIDGDLRRHLCGRLCFRLAWESCGPAEEDQRVIWVDLDPCRDECYEAVFRLPPGTLAAGECGNIYCFCVTVSSRMECDGRTFTGLIHGFCRDICCIMVRPA